MLNSLRRHIYVLIIFLVTIHAFTENPASFFIGKSWRTFPRSKPLNIYSNTGKTKFDLADFGIDPENYPTARRDESVVEKFFAQSVQVSDPYRWMENPKFAETQQFITNLNAISKPYLAKAPARRQIRDRLSEVLQQKICGCMNKHGDYYYYWLSSGLQNQSILYRRKSLNGEDELFFDPNTLSNDGSISLGQTSFSNDGKLMAYTVSEKGSDLSVLKFRNFNGVLLKDEVPRMKQSSISWLPDSKGVFYSKYASHKRAHLGTVVEKDEFHSLYFHRIGTSYLEDVLIADFRELQKPSLWITGSVSKEGGLLFIYVYDRDSSNCVYYSDLKAIDYRIEAKLNLTLLFNDTKSSFTIVDYDEKTKSALVMTNHEAPSLKLVRINVSNTVLYENRYQWETVIEAQSDRTLTTVEPVDGDKLLVEYLEDVKSSLSVFDSKSGDLLYKIPLGVGSVVQCYVNKSDSETIFGFQTFLEPPKYFRLDFSQILKTELLEMEEIQHSFDFRGIDTSDFVVKQEFFESKDSTKIPMFLIMKKDTKINGKNPLLLYGYGGFSIPMLPHYSTLHNLFVKHFHGIIAIANIRGGGEYGSTWHERGSRANKQNVFDDFIGAAEYLIEQKYTSARRLAIQGGSNGGLLVAACSQQRPELFGAVINQVGVMDMLRFHKFTVGSSWISEYGNPENPQEFEYIFRYSPLHNVERLAPGIEWPSTLLMTADHDDRVVPSHTLKYAAQLYHMFRSRRETRLVQRNPVIVRVEMDAGHGAGKSIVKVIDEAVDIMSFLQRVLLLEWYD